MNENDTTRKRLIAHFNAYPHLQAEDIFKYLFQSAFGCEHLVSNEEAALAYIKREYEAVSKTALPCIEPLDGEYSRVHLSCLNAGPSPEVLAKVFCLSAKKEEDGRAALEQKIEIAKELVANGALPLDSDEFTQKLATWKDLGYPALHHSNSFRTTYKPAYRVISNRYAALLPFFAKTQSMKKIIVIGCPGAGKSTFARALQQKTNIPLHHLDMMFWNKDKTTVPKSVFLDRLSAVLKTDEWIIDGNYGSTLELRLAACDTAVFLDYPLEICLNGIKERQGKPRADMPWIETEEDAEFIEFIKSYNEQQKPKVLELFKKYKDKNVIVFTSREQANTFLEGVVL